MYCVLNMWLPYFQKHWSIFSPLPGIQVLTWQLQNVEQVWVGWIGEKESSCCSGQCYKGAFPPPSRETILQSNKLTNLDLFTCFLCICCLLTAQVCEKLGQFGCEWTEWGGLWGMEKRTVREGKDDCEGGKRRLWGRNIRTVREER